MSASISEKREEISKMKANGVIEAWRGSNRARRRKVVISEAQSSMASLSNQMLKAGQWRKRRLGIGENVAKARMAKAAW
jgi:hypothetical protein